MQQVEDFLDGSIAAEGYVIRESTGEYGEDHRIDLSGIDSEALKPRFEQGRKHTEAERVKGLVARQLRKMVRLNRRRMDYLERFRRMIDEYNSGSVSVDGFFSCLMRLARGLTEEGQHAVSEYLRGGDRPLRPPHQPELQLMKMERATVRKTARELLTTLKHEKLGLARRKREQARPSVRVTIETWRTRACRGRNRRR